ncbi:neutral and basic amino acid transport protein rBAT-like isoform X2 [Zootermopsis nevadensis]|nr:neutral and basic amino acid transport protein rBAT-like isoform X2 [Zootermopsis nevadensis]XP_021923291.1 neutral and basic amino acid transport protein rBAT-like isoform X2 [Zootermopsis nevadensis]
MAYERQISPTSIDELSSLPGLNCDATLGFVGLTATDMHPNEHNIIHHNDEVQQEFIPTRSVQSVMESSSSSSSVMQEPTVCAQLLSSHHYQHLTKASDVDPFACQENGGKPPLTGLQLAVRKSPDDFCFMSWNWPLIRKFSFWSAVSLLMACVCIVITLIARLPTDCKPHHAWWQGTIFYEVFPASFKDDNSDGIGDLRGLGKQAFYFTSLGVKVVRLNSIFHADYYPEGYEDVQNLTEISPVLGNMKDFNFAINTLHKHNISVVLDFPLSPFIEQLRLTEKEVPAETDVSVKETSWPVHTDSTTEDKTGRNINVEASNRINTKQIHNDNIVTNAISFWLTNGVDGIYLKGLECLVSEPNFASLMQEWRRITKSFNKGFGHEKIVMCSMDVINALDPEDDSRKVEAVLQNIDLIDVRLDIVSNGTRGLKTQVDKVVKGILFSKPGYPWIHWHMGSIGTKRLASQLPTANASLAAVALEMILPGTPSIFYGDEVGLEELKDPEGEMNDLKHIHHLSPLQWPAQHPELRFTLPHILPWLPLSSVSSNVAAGHETIVQTISKLREDTPSIYMDGVYKDNEKLPNYEIRTVDNNIVTVERSYPRRHSYVVVSNFGSQTQTKDLSSIYYGGEVVADLQGRVGRYLTFHALTLSAGEFIIIKLDK